MLRRKVHCGWVGFRRGSIVLSVVVGAICSAAPLRAQPGTDAMMRALAHEDAGRSRDAAAAFRAALAMNDPAPALYGLERAYADIGWADTTLVVIDSVLRARPRDRAARIVRLRTLTSLGRLQDERTAFEEWVRTGPSDAAPFREYARILLETGRAASADTVLQRAQGALGGAGQFAPEVAQLNAALRRWDGAAKSWRIAVTNQPALAQAARFSLQAVPLAERDEVREIFLAPPVRAGPRRALASLEIAWGTAARGWSALRELPPGIESAEGWRDFADEAEAAEAWLPARDALVALYSAQRDDALALRAAEAALAGGDARSAEELAARVSPSGAGAGRGALLLRVRALAALGRADHAERLVRQLATALDADGLRAARSSVADAWVRTGDLARATAALGDDTTSGDGSARGWLSLYAGDLRAARRGLRGTAETSRITTIAQAVLARSRADVAPATGAAFLALARGDSLAAAAAFERAAPETGDAAPLMLAIAARLHSRADAASATRLWRLVVERYPDAPEAPEGDLEWARGLQRSNDLIGAAARLEHLILTYPQSALVPQARRERDVLRSESAPSSGAPTSRRP